MRRELIEALNYPKFLVQELIDQRDCHHDNLFDATSECCHQCELNRDCHWVSCLNDFSGFDGKATHTINASLRYGMNLVEALRSESRHDATCMCEPCDWIRDSQRLTEAYDEGFSVNSYRKN